MKKFVLMVTIALFFVATVKAQSAKFGLTGGLNMSKVSSFTYYENNTSTQEKVQTEFKPGFHAGVFVDIGLISNFSIQPEILYSQKGYKTHYTLLNDERTKTVSYSYLDIPILAKFKTGTGFNLFAGPSVSFWLNSRSKDSGENIIIESKNNEINKDNFRKADIGGLVGAGYDFGQVSLNLDYNFGLQTLDKYDSSVKARNNNIQLSLGLNF